jgi:serine/threonine protein kinase
MGRTPIRSETIILFGVSMVAHRNAPVFDHSPIVGLSAEPCGVHVVISCAPDDRPGGLPHYRIESRLGEGGMGIVGRALDSKLTVSSPSRFATRSAGRSCAQEALRAGDSGGIGAQSFHDRHDPRHRHGRWRRLHRDGVCAGQSLDRVIPRRGLPLAEVLHYAIEIADALAGAHAAGIVHRELKPGNIMVPCGPERLIATWCGRSPRMQSAPAQLTIDGRGRAVASASDTPDHGLLAMSA